MRDLACCKGRAEGVARGVVCRHTGAAIARGPKRSHGRGCNGMKIKIDIDCTPQEARAFFGLPHVEPMQEAVLGKDPGSPGRIP